MHDTYNVEMMKKALVLAKRALGRASPNPMVGAIVVDSQGELVGQGWHQGPGTPHAEVVALDQAGPRAQGATLFVTLEPCSHHGRTPPCVQRVIEAGVRRVVAAMGDPNPLVNGSGFRQLKEAGIAVEVGLLEREALLLNRAFVTWVTQKRPFVTLKLAQSLDGNAATHTGESKWITSAESRGHAHLIRSHVDAIVVGIETVLADDPLLTARPSEGEVHQPLRVILDSQARLPTDARCLVQPGGQILVAVSNRAPERRLHQLKAAGAHVWVSPGDEDRVDIRALLAHLAACEVTHVLVEGGPTLRGSFVDADLVDEVHAYIAPLLIGGRDALPSLGGVGRAELATATRLIDTEWTGLGPDLYLYGRVPRPFLGDQPNHH